MVTGPRTITACMFLNIHDRYTHTTSLWDLMSLDLWAPAYSLWRLRPEARAPRNKKQAAWSAAKLRAGTLFL